MPPRESKLVSRSSRKATVAKTVFVMVARKCTLLWNILRTQFNSDNSVESGYQHWMWTPAAILSRDLSSCKLGN